MGYETIDDHFNFPLPLQKKTDLNKQWICFVKRINW